MANPEICLTLSTPGYVEEHAHFGGGSSMGIDKLGEWVQSAHHAYAREAYTMALTLTRCQQEPLEEPKTCPGLHRHLLTRQDGSYACADCGAGLY